MVGVDRGLHTDHVKSHAVLGLRHAVPGGGHGVHGGGVGGGQVRGGGGGGVVVAGVVLVEGLHLLQYVGGVVLVHGGWGGQGGGDGQTHRGVWGE